MVSDREPRYRLVDSNGNVVGSLYAETDGSLRLQEGTSGSDYEVEFETDGAFIAPKVRITDARSTFTRGGEDEYTETKRIPDDDILAVDHIAKPHVTVTATSATGTFACGFDSITDLGSDDLNVVGGDTTLTGTTGPDGNKNVANDDNTFYFENRTGSELPVKVIVK